ncbi:MAG: chemotaxis response regulator protein-glutamate methylesterase, partial [Desulfobulbaceae bacterium]|nr:chemotaxis response regulator protein-glutamate methylesterase [Desulfobulbaceae bacterium]
CWRGDGTAILLTGMGADGAQGLLALHKRGFHTIAQDKETSVVFGMPKIAIELGAADTVLPVEKIGEELLKNL